MTFRIRQPIEGRIIDGGGAERLALGSMSLFHSRGMSARFADRPKLMIEPYASFILMEYSFHGTKQWSDDKATPIQWKQLFTL